MDDVGGARVLIVDDEQGMLDNCERMLSRAGYVPQTLLDPAPIRDIFHEFRPDVLLLDLRFPKHDGMTILTVAQAEDPSLPVIIMTAYATVASAVNAIREGAFDYLTKPFTADQLLVSVERAARHGGLKRENEALKQQIAQGERPRSIIGSSPSFIKLLEKAKKAAPTNANVLLCGESGTGKEMVAQFIHANSSRSTRPFVPVDCAALPDNLLESELFGFERGAFTGAVARKKGLLEEVHGGTAFLDEITQLSTDLQSKLLRVIEERQIRRLGGSAIIDVDFRVIAATNVDLEAEVAAGRFREDLFYRLNVIPLYLPPLRERPGDIALLVQHFVSEFAAAQGTEPPRVSPQVWEFLQRHRWRGNVREVRNLAERLVVLDEDGRITIADLPEGFRPSISLAPGDSEQAWGYEVSRDQAMRAFRTDYLARLLESSGGNVTKAARAAGVSRRTLHRWIAAGQASGEEPDS
jgi:DNA-binding NtrC family response regulator